MASREPLRILSLDGGGVRGLSSLLILENIMEKIRETRGLHHVPRPCDYFDLIGGTSTGGIIAIMLGRLGMTVDECVRAYRKVAEQAFTRKRSSIFPARPSGAFSAEALENAIKETVRKFCVEETCMMSRREDRPTSKTCSHSHVPFRDEECTKTVVLAITKEDVDAQPTLFKTYDKSAGLDKCTIWQVARATSAATTFFNSIGVGRDEIEFIDAGFGYNNPCDILIREGQQQFPERTRMQVLSIGTGVGNDATIKDTRLSIIKALKITATSSKKVAASLDSQYGGDGQYYRFNVDHGLQDIRLSDWEKAGKISAHTHNYLGKAENKRMIKKFVESLAGINSAGGEGHEAGEHLDSNSEEDRIRNRAKLLGLLANLAPAITQASGATEHYAMRTELPEDVSAWVRKPSILRSPRTEYGGPNQYSAFGGLRNVRSFRHSLPGDGAIANDPTIPDPCSSRLGEGRQFRHSSPMGSTGNPFHELPANEEPTGAPTGQAHRPDLPGLTSMSPNTSRRTSTSEADGGSRSRTVSRNFSDQTTISSHGSFSPPSFKHPDPETELTTVPNSVYATTAKITGWTRQPSHSQNSLPSDRASLSTNSNLTRFESTQSLIQRSDINEKFVNAASGSKKHHMKVLLEILGRDTKRLQLEPESFNIALLKLSKKETDDKGRVDALKALLEKGNPDIDCRDRNFGCTPLIWAIRLNQVDVWTLLISKGASLTVRDSVEDRTPLMWAAATREGSFQVAGALLTKSQARPYLNDRDRSGKTALDLALDLALALKKNGDYKTCKLLCAYGAERG